MGALPDRLTSRFARHVSRPPVHADFVTSNAHGIPLDLWSAQGGNVKFEQLPLHDSPVLIAEKTVQAIQLEP